MKTFYLLFLSFLKALCDTRLYLGMLLIGFIEMIIFGLLLLIISNVLPSIATVSAYIFAITIFLLTPLYMIIEITYQKYIFRNC